MGIQIYGPKTGVSLVSLSQLTEMRRQPARIEVYRELARLLPPIVCVGYRSGLRDCICACVHDGDMGDVDLTVIQDFRSEWTHEPSGPWS